MTRRGSDHGRRRRARAVTLGATPGERLHKVLARSGLGSRRTIEARIGAGEVIVNGRPAQTGQAVAIGDLITVAGKAWKVVAESALPQEGPRVIMYHKPAGEICTRHDPEGRPDVFERLPRLPGRRWVAVGRLDINTSGLLLFTDDGGLAHRLMHPSGGLDREYQVRVHGEVTDATLQRLRTGVIIDGAPASFAELTRGAGEGRNQWFRVTVREGRYRMVRRLWESQDCQVSRLIRIRFGPVSLPRDLRRGDFRDLTPAQINALIAALPDSATENRAATRKSGSTRSRRAHQGD